MLRRIPFSVNVVYHKLSLKGRAKFTQRKRRERKAKVNLLRYRRAVRMFTEHDQVDFLHYKSMNLLYVIKAGIQQVISPSNSVL